MQIPPESLKANQSLNSHASKGKGISCLMKRKRNRGNNATNRNPHPAQPDAITKGECQNPEKTKISKGSYLLQPALKTVIGDATGKNAWWCAVKGRSEGAEKNGETFRTITL